MNCFSLTRPKQLDDLWKIACERLSRFGRKHDFVAVAACEAAEPIPLGLVLPAVALRQFGRQERLHRRKL